MIYPKYLDMSNQIHTSPKVEQGHLTPWYTLQPLYNSHPLEVMEVSVVETLLLWRGGFCCKIALWGIQKVAVIGRWLFLEVTISGGSTDVSKHLVVE